MTNKKNTKNTNERKNNMAQNKTKKNIKEIVLYIVFGVLTTVVNFVVFKLFNMLLGEKLYLLNNTVAFIVSVLFAYVTNKIWVFESKKRSYLLSSDSFFTRLFVGIISLNISLNAFAKSFRSILRFSPVRHFVINSSELISPDS